MKNLVAVVLLVVCVSIFITTTTTNAVPHHQYHQPHHFPNKRQAEYVSSLGSYEVVTPRRVGGDGRFLSHALEHAHDATIDTRKRRRRRDVSGGGGEPYEDHDLHYHLTLDGDDHQVTLRPNSNFLAPHAVVERVRGPTTNKGPLEVVGGRRSCHYHGHVRNHTASRVALSACDGLRGYIRTDTAEYFLEPVKDHTRTAPDSPHPHLVYKRAALPNSGTHSCSTPDAYDKAMHSREEWEEEQRAERWRRSVEEEEEEGKTQRRRRRKRSLEEKSESRSRSKRSVSVERNVEVTVVADKKMIDYYSNEDITTYILTVMNMVSSVYHDASIGNAVNIYVVRIMLLEDPQYEEELDISHNADDTLRSFCHWQQMINPGNETHPYHHDVAVLITRYNICSRVTDRCATLGVSEIAGMCQPLRSCNVNEDTGLQIALTIAHELGHNFGMNHDGPQNGCEVLYGSSQHVMSPHLTNDAAPVTWSNCSRHEITHFLDREWGSCLEDDPPEVEYNFPELPPGAMYDADHQCRLSFGSGATHCAGIEGVERVCQTLWCHLDNRCITRMEPAAEGTQCGKHKWCSSGECVTMGERPAAIHGNWGPWSEWSECSRTCGAGVATALRHCDNPKPANGGRYCTGDRKKYKICNTEECDENGVSFRGVQCSVYDQQPYKGGNHSWLPVMFDHSPCQLDCKPDNEFYSVKLKDTVIDGTPCKPGTMDMCIHGVCKRVACDMTIEGAAQEDRCGLCHGDGTQCVTTKGLFNMTRGSGYVPAVTFPKAARNVKVVEVRGAANYLAVTDNATGDYFLNGNWIIQWSGEYSAHGAMMYYSREGETEELFLPGPLKHPLTLMLLFQTENPGLQWEYTLPHENATYTPTFSWHHADWSVCTSTCGGGTQVSRVQCLEKEAGLVEEQYCGNHTRPLDLTRPCNTHACPAWWWSGPWQPCSLTCGDHGMRRRTVICVRSFGPSEQMALMDSACDNSVKPHETEPCPSLPQCHHQLDWNVGQWFRTCGLDPCEYEEREVVCVTPGGGCDPLSRPPDRRQCGNITCGVWEVDSWSQCSAHCGEGVQFRGISCVGGLACLERDEPMSVQECIGDCLEEVMQDEEEGEEKKHAKPEKEQYNREETTHEESNKIYHEADDENKEEKKKKEEKVADKDNKNTRKDDDKKRTRVEEEQTFMELDDKLLNPSNASSNTKTTTPVSLTTVTPMSTKSNSPTTSLPITSIADDTVPHVIPESNKQPSSKLAHNSTPAPSTINTKSPSLPQSINETSTSTPTTVTSITSPISDNSKTVQTDEPKAATSIPPLGSTTTDTITTTSSILENTSTDTKPTGPPQSSSTLPSVTEEDEIFTMPATTAKISEAEDTKDQKVGKEFDVSSSLPMIPTEPYEPLIIDTTIMTTLETQISTMQPTESSTFTEESESTEKEEVLENTISSSSEALDKERQSEIESNVTKEKMKSDENNREAKHDDFSGDNISTGNEETPKKSAYPSDFGNEIDVDTKVKGGTDKASENKTIFTEEHKNGKGPGFRLDLQNDEGVASKSDSKTKSSKKATEVGSKREKEDLNNTNLEDDSETENDEIEESTWVEEPTEEIDSKEEEDTPHVFPDLEEPVEERPEGVVVDKIDIEGYEVIEIVELPPKGKKKKKRKKVLLHTGAEAVDVLHKLAEEQEEKRQLLTPAPTAEYEPDYQWNITQWSECSAECDGGLQGRNVQCLEQITGVPVHHERCPQPRPDNVQSCNTEDCGEWETGEWGECSSECDVGERLRPVECPSGLQCPSSSRPPEVEPCNPGPCVKWVQGPWSLCTKSCGGGYQIRHVRCVDIRTEEVVRTCPREGRPKHKMACHNHRCPKNHRGENRRGEGRRGQQRQCRDRLDSKLCRRLKHMCGTKFFRIKCCRTCLRRAG